MLLDVTIHVAGDVMSFLVALRSLPEQVSNHARLMMQLP